MLRKELEEMLHLIRLSSLDLVPLLLSATLCKQRLNAAHAAHQVMLIKYLGTLGHPPVALSMHWRGL